MAENGRVPDEPGAPQKRPCPVLGYLRRWATIRDRPGLVEAIFAGVFCILIILLVWHAVTVGPVEQRLVSRSTLPSLTETVRSFPRLWSERALARGAFASLGRVFGGFLLAVVVAVPLGVSAGAFKRLHAFLRPLAIFGRNVPIAALIPLTLIWFGLEEIQKVMFIFLASVSFVFSDTVTAVDGVPDIYLDTAYTLGARTTPRRGFTLAGLVAAGYAVVFALAYALLVKRSSAAGDAVLRTAWNRGLLTAAVGGLVVGFLLWFPILCHQAVRKVLLALALPDVVNSLRLFFGLAFGYIMLAEVIDAEYGLGHIIIMSQRRGPREHIYLSLIIIAILAFGIDRGLLALQRRLFPYRHTGGK